MSKAITCDNCGTTLVLSDAGEDPDGECVGWLELRAGGTVFGKPKFRWDVCTRACAQQLLDSPVMEPVDDWLETVTGVARTIREHEDDQ